MNDSWHKQQYDLVREMHPELPEWDSLSDEKKANIRAANDRQHDFMNRLGEAIRTGGPLPNPLEK